jgi:glycosyltransferase involved in cell wall biosynthesis
MGRYLDAVPETVATILATQDVEHQVRPREVAWLQPGVERWRVRRRARRLTRVEPRYVRQADAVLAVSAADATALARLRGGDGVYVIPPWLDTAKLRAITPESVVPGRLTFMGALDRVANRAAAHFLLDEVWPRVRAARAGTTLWLVGANPSERLRRRAHDDPRLEVTGWVPDLAAVWAATDVALAPSIVGGGCLLKIIQPMAAGRPVVTTPLGTPQETAVVADGANAFATAVTALLDDRERWQRLATAGRRYVLREMDWERSMDKLETVYATALESRRRAICR